MTLQGTKTHAHVMGRNDRHHPDIPPIHITTISQSIYTFRLINDINKIQELVNSVSSSHYMMIAIHPFFDHVTTVLLSAG